MCPVRNVTYVSGRSFFRINGLVGRVSAGEAGVDIAVAMRFSLARRSTVRFLDQASNGPNCAMLATCDHSVTKSVTMDFGLKNDCDSLDL
jgi:hypothetical protein